MGDRTPPPSSRRLAPGRLRRRGRRMRTPSPDSRDNEDSESALRAPPNRRSTRGRNLHEALNRAARQENHNHNNNNSHQNHNDDTVRPEDRPDHEERVEGGLNRAPSAVQPELKF